MAEAIVMPKLGNTVESAMILTWYVAVGDAIRAGDILCEIETDKAAMEVESSASGVVLACFFEEGDVVPVLENIAAVGQSGESFAELQPNAADAPVSGSRAESGGEPAATEDAVSAAPRQEPRGSERVFISPRAQALAQRQGVDYGQLRGSGPGGRIIERDIEALLAAQPKVSPVAKAMLDSGEFVIDDRQPPAARVTKQHLMPAPSESAEPVKPAAVEAIPMRGIREVIAKRMLAAAQTSAQLTLQRSADARALVAFRQRLKDSDPALGLQAVSINDLLLFALARTLPAFPDVNAVYENETIYQHRAVHLGMAVDTPRGLLVPVMRQANALSLKQLADEAHRLADACQAGKILPDEMAGGTFTLTNLGGLGIEHFTPILNLPQAAILGAGGIQLKPVPGTAGEVEFVPHISLSLTINHQVLDGAPAARFLAQLARAIAQIDLLTAL